MQDTALTIRYIIPDAFLDLMSTVPDNFLCPTLDIDLAWHTHQLRSDDYHNITTTCIQRFVDHNDKVTEGTLGDAYSLTAKLWLKRYGVPYSSCGCHQGEGLIQLLESRFSMPGRMRIWSKSKESSSERRKRMILQMDQELGEGERQSSHPSTHNIIQVTGHSQEETCRRLRAKLNEQRDRHSPNAIDIKDPEKAALAALFHKRPSHSDPFIYNAGNDQHRGSFTTEDGRDAMRSPILDADRLWSSKAGDLSGMSRQPYWGVGMGAGIAGLSVAGGAAAWGLYSEDCHQVDHSEMVETRGKSSKQWCSLGFRYS